MQKDFWGLGPVQAKSYMMDDLLLVVMRGGMTTAERTMLEFGQEDLVRDFRQTFENEMTQNLTAKGNLATGRLARSRMRPERRHRRHRPANPRLRPRAPEHIATLDPRVSWSGPAVREREICRRGGRRSSEALGRLRATLGPLSVPDGVPTGPRCSSPVVPREPQGKTVTPPALLIARVAALIRG